MKRAVCIVCGEPWTASGNPGHCFSCDRDSFFIISEIGTKQQQNEEKANSEKPEPDSDRGEVAFVRRSTEMTVKELVRETLNQYINDEIMLDAFYQWSSNPTSMGAGYGLEENYPYIIENLRERYSLSTQQTEVIKNQLTMSCDILVRKAKEQAIEAKEAKYQIGKIRVAFRTELEQGQYQKQLRQGVLRRLRVLSEETRKALLLLNLLEKYFGSVSPPQEYYYLTNQPEFQAYYRSVYADTAPIEQITQEIINSGACNELYWIPVEKATSIPQSQLVKAVVPTIPELESFGTITLPAPDVSSLLDAFWADEKFDLLRLIDIICHLKNGICKVNQLPEGADIPGFMGSHDSMGPHDSIVALSPCILAETRQYLDKMKDEKIEPIRKTLARALLSVDKEVKPDGDLNVLSTNNAETLWIFETSSYPPLYVYLAPWITATAPTEKPTYFKINGKPHVLLIIPFQSKPSLLTTIEHIPSLSLNDSRHEKSISIINDWHNPSECEILLGQSHPFVDKLLSAISNSGEVPIIESPTEVPIKIIKPETDVSSPVFIPEDWVLVGDDKVGKQWGIIGKSNNKKVRFDLNAPHVVFVCGKMGYGKGYTIGVLTEMLVAESIQGLSDVTKKATIIVLYKPREDLPSEFHSITEPNDVAVEVARLRSEYQLEPRQLVSPDNFKVFVDPAVYGRAAQKFRDNYKTDNVLPLYIDPSSLTGDEWGIVLCAGAHTEQLYVKRLFTILEKLQDETFDLQRVRTEIDNDEVLTKQQKKLAGSRLDILSNYIEKGREQEFIRKLALGGVNIFDFRQTIRTPDDVFSVMTLVISVLQTKEGLENEPFVFVINEAHDFFKKGIASDFVDSIERLIRRRRHGANWLLIDTHFPSDVDDNIIKLADMKVVHYMDKMVDSPILHKGFGTTIKEFSTLSKGQAFIMADQTSVGPSQVLKVSIRPRLTKHGAPTKLAS